MQKSLIAPEVITQHSLHLPRLNIRFSWLQLISVIIVALVLLPLVYLGLRAAGAGAEGVEYLTAERTVSVMLNSLWLMLTVTVSACLIGIPFAWLTTRTD